MREILFKGFHECKDGTQKAYYDDEWYKGEWVYGYYVPCCHGKFPCVPCIVTEPDGKWGSIEVAPETVCQYTGLKDKNGKKIFENDICNNGYYNDIVIWRNFGYHCDSLVMHDKWLEIVGNKFENPELVEVEE